MSIKYNLKKTSKPLVRHLQLKKRACPVCSSKKKLNILNINNWKKMDNKGKVYAINKKYCICKKCDLVYTNPTVDPKIFDKLYENSIVGSFFNSKNSKNSNKIKFFDNLIKKYISKKYKVLEVGCGSGVLLKHLSTKYKFKKKNLLGIEPSKEIFKKLIKNKFFKIKNIFLDSLKQKKNYDFIVMDNVFEHFEFPRKSLKKISNILNDKGLIYISIPNTEKIKGVQDDPFNHTCNYNSNNIRTLLNNNNFKIIKLSKDTNLINLIAKKSNNQLKIFKPNKKFFHNLRFKLKKINNKLKLLYKRADKIKLQIYKNNKKIVVFGAGNYSLWILSILKIEKFIKYGVDNNLIYENTIRNNITIYNPSKLKNIDYDKILVLSGVFKKDILNQLLQMKIKRNKIILF